MLINIHRPVVTEVKDFPPDDGAPRGFRVIQIRDQNTTGAVLDVFIERDWSDWDQLVADVEKNRRQS